MEIKVHYPNRLFLLIILVFLINSTGISQDTIEPSWEISPEMGVITSYYGRTNRLFTNKTLIRPIFGVAVVKNVNKNYKIKLQTDFVTIGYIDKYNNPFVANMQYQDDFILPYIQTDLTINSTLNLKKLKFRSLSLGAGVFLGKILTPYITTKSLGNDTCTCKNGTIINYSSFNWGFLAAADLNLQAYLKLPISLNVKYNLGISDIRDSNISPITGIAYPTIVTSNSLSIQLNYWFTLSKKKHLNKTFIYSEN
ncbi:hypothetical protein VB264_23680 [Arcicella aquatica]|uniref:Outer membrane protein beta-barrel domain-containing protein n=1 Tax=Arcicella aquatica TaxID=217141 RepID=A0ABU5QUP1_9BACT|nr:hypothetical protein [Arcicella aquatica]MEA5260821.1 hypothetical protein [Arcicella aquatica]